MMLSLERLNLRAVAGQVESNDDIITIHYDYGELINGMKWKDEYCDNPPQYIEKEYK